MLVMTLRTVTLDAPCRWCACSTTSSTVVPCRASRSASQPSAGVGARVLVAQPLGQLRGEDLGQRARGAGPDVQFQRRARVAGGEQPVGELLRVGALAPPGADLVGEAAQVLDQDDAQRDGHRPQLADGQRLDTLVGGDVAAQDQRVEMAVGVRDEGPGQPEHARVAGERAARELGQLAVVAGRQVVADLAHLLLDEVVVVQQPLGRRHHAATALEFGGAGAVGGQQHPGVVVQSPLQGQDGRGMVRDGLGRGQGLRVQFQPVGAEQLLAHGRRVVPGRGRRPAPGGPRLQAGPCASGARRSYSRSITGSREPCASRLRTAASMSAAFAR